MADEPTPPAAFPTTQPLAPLAPRAADNRRQAIRAHCVQVLSRSGRPTLYVALAQAVVTPLILYLFAPLPVPMELKILVAIAVGVSIIVPYYLFSLERKLNAVVQLLELERLHTSAER